MPSSDDLRTLLPLKPADLLLLAVLDEEPTHGYRLALEMEDRSGGTVRVRPGDVYRVLHRLETQELVRADEPEGSSSRKRTVYHLTSTGRRVLLEEARRLASLSRKILARSVAAEESAG